MIRTQIYISKDTHTQLLQIAHARREALARVVREFIDAGLKKTSLDRSGAKNLQELGRLNLRGGPKDLSQNIDRYLYGA